MFALGIESSCKPMEECRSWFIMSL